MVSWVAWSLVYKKLFTKSQITSAKSFEGGIVKNVDSSKQCDQLVLCFIKSYTTMKTCPIQTM